MLKSRLSDDMKHYFTFTSIVACNCILLNEVPQIIRSKSHNSAAQCKSSHVLSEYQKIAAQPNRKVLIYGASTHGKGLTDAMSGFGVKGPLLKAN